MIALLLIPHLLHIQGLVYSATADIITESGTVPDKTYYIADNVSTIAIAGVSSPTAAGDDIGSLTGVKYYTRTTGNGSYIFAPGNDIAGVLKYLAMLVYFI